MSDTKQDEFLQEVQVDTYRGGGVAVRVTHRPTGLVVTVDDEPIEVLARRKALAKLAERVDACPDAEHDPNCQDGWSFVACNYRTTDHEAREIA